jgi:hypothetical protein
MKVIQAETLGHIFVSRKRGLLKWSVSMVCFCVWKLSGGKSESRQEQTDLSADWKAPLCREEVEDVAQSVCDLMGPTEEGDLSNFLVTQRVHQLFQVARYCHQSRRA